MSDQGRNPFSGADADGAAKTPLAPAGATQPMTPVPPASAAGKPVNLPPPAAPTTPKPVSSQPSVKDVARTRPAVEQAPPLDEKESKPDSRAVLLGGAGLVVAIIALLLALFSGGDDSLVGTEDIADSAITTPKIADGSVSAEKLAEGTLQEGPRGPSGPKGVAGDRGPRGVAGAPGISDRQNVTRSSVSDSSTSKQVTATCPATSELLYGGASIATESGTSKDVALQASAPAANSTTTWEASALETKPTDEAWGITVNIVCAEFAKPNTKKDSGGSNSSSKTGPANSGSSTEPGGVQTLPAPAPDQPSSSAPAVPKGK